MGGRDGSLARGRRPCTIVPLGALGRSGGKVVCSGGGGGGGARRDSGRGVSTQNWRCNNSRTGVLATAVDGPNSATALITNSHCSLSLHRAGSIAGSGCPSSSEHGY